MAHGAPDYSNVKKEGLVFRIDDMAELAVRLGSIVSYDRRGDVYWYTGFNEGLGDILQATVGANSLIGLVNSMYEHQPFACRVRTGADAGNYAYIARRFAWPKTTKMGFQASVRISTATTEVWLSIATFDGSVRRKCTMRIKPVALTLDIYDADTSSWVTIDDLTSFSSVAHFLHLKIVMDIVDNKFVRLLLDNVEYDVSDYAATTQVNAQTKSVFVEIDNFSNESVIDSIFVDNFILTVNE